MFKVSLAINVDPGRTLRGLRDSVKRRIVRKGVRRASAGARRDVKAALPKRTGALVASVSTKVSTKKEGVRVTGVIGPRSQYRKRGKRPVRYAHIVEFGAKHMQGRYAMRKTFRSNKAQYIQTMTTTIADEVRIELAKAGAK